MKYKRKGVEFICLQQLEVKKAQQKKTRAKSSYGTCDDVGRAKSSCCMSSSKILRINRLL